MITPLSGWRGEPPVSREPTPAELDRRCPYCGEVPLFGASQLCPAFDELLEQAASEAR